MINVLSRLVSIDKFRNGVRPLIPITGSSKVEGELYSSETQAPRTQATTPPSDTQDTILVCALIEAFGPIM